MTLRAFMNEIINPWMRTRGPQHDIVLSTRIRLARNFSEIPFPEGASAKEKAEVLEHFKENYDQTSYGDDEKFVFINVNDLTSIKKSILIEKHLISPQLLKSDDTGILLSQSEQVSMMINEEDHMRLQLYLPGLQLKEALQKAFQLDDLFEEKIDYAFNGDIGYLTCCPTNVGTGLRASVMMHLPALVLTKRINQMMPAINQLGYVVRGIYGEGSGALGNIFQVSNQITLGKTEEDIVSDLERIIIQLIEQEREARKYLLGSSKIRLEDRIYRSYGILQHSRIIDSVEAATHISNIRLGIDLGMIKEISRAILNECILLSQPGILQYYAQAVLSENERDVLRASLIRNRLKLDNSRRDCDDV